MKKTLLTIIAIFALLTVSNAQNYYKTVITAKGIGVQAPGVVDPQGGFRVDFNVIKSINGTYETVIQFDDMYQVLVNSNGQEIGPRINLEWNLPPSPPEVQITKAGNCINIKFKQTNSSKFCTSGVYFTNYIANSRPDYYDGIPIVFILP